MLLQPGLDALVTGGFVEPAACLRVGVQEAHIVELAGDGRDGGGVGDEVVALFADVGVGVVVTA